MTDLGHMTAEQIDYHARKLGYTFYREHFPWGKITGAYRHESGRIAFVDMGVWYSPLEYKKLLQETWVPQTLDGCRYLKNLDKHFSEICGG